MTKRETAAERRAREAQEAREADACWEAEKPMRLLEALARAHDLGVEAQVFNRHDNVMYYTFKTCVDYDGNYSDTVAELSERIMKCIEDDLDSIAAERKRKMRLEQVKQELLARLSPEEKEALGLN